MQLSASECIRVGWNTTKGRFWFFVGAAFTIVVINVVLRIVNTGITEAGKTTGLGGEFLALLAILALSLFVSTLLNMGMLRFSLTAHDTPHTARLSALWSPHPFWNYLGTSLLLFVIVVIGLIVLIIPGVILSLMFGMSTYLVVDRGLSPIAALTESARMTRGNRVNLLLLGLILALINLLGLLALGVGLLVTIPISMVATAHAYRTLSSNMDAQQTGSTPEAVLQSA